MSADLHHLAAAYALDALDDLERRQFEVHYPSCEICSSEVAEFRAVAGSLATSTAVTAPASLKGSVMAEITQTRQLSPLTTSAQSRSRRPGQILAAAAAALVLLAGVLAVTLPDDDTSYNDVASSADAVVTTLDPVVEGQVGNLQIVWSGELDQVAVVGSNLGDPGVGKAYALWFLLDDGVAPAALFRPENGSVTDVIAIDDIDANGWGITIEPAAGSDQPTTEVIFAGTL